MIRINPPYFMGCLLHVSLFLLFYLIFIIYSCVDYSINSERKQQSSVNTEYRTVKAIAITKFAVLSVLTCTNSFCVWCLRSYGIQKRAKRRLDIAFSAFIVLTSVS